MGDLQSTRRGVGFPEKFVAGVQLGTATGGRDSGDGRGRRMGGEVEAPQCRRLLKCEVSLNSESDSRCSRLTITLHPTTSTLLCGVPLSLLQSSLQFRSSPTFSPRSLAPLPLSTSRAYPAFDAQRCFAGMAKSSPKKKGNARAQQAATSKPAGPKATKGQPAAAAPSTRRKFLAGPSS